MNYSPQQTNDPYDDEYLRAVIPTLYEYARIKIEQYSCHCASESNEQKRKSAEFFLTEAFKNYYAGQSKWNPKKYRKFIVFIWIKIRSLINQEYLKKGYVTSQYWDGLFEHLVDFASIHSLSVKFLIWELIWVKFRIFLKCEHFAENDELMEYNNNVDELLECNDLLWGSFKFKRDCGPDKF